MAERLSGRKPSKAEIEQLSRRFAILIRGGQALDAIEHGGLYSSCHGGRFFDPLRNPWSEAEAAKRLLREQRSLGGNK